MYLDYTQIMNTPAPQGRVDTQTMDGLWRQWDVCRHLLAKFTKSAKIHAGVKICYLERGHKENMERRAAYYRKAVPRALRELRAMEHYNFALRVRAWVLGSKKRRLKLRALFGEKRLASWHARVQKRLKELADINNGANSQQVSEYKTSPETYLETNNEQVPGFIPGSRAANTELYDYALDPAPQEYSLRSATSAGSYTCDIVQEDSPELSPKPIRKQSVRAWYILPRLPLLPRIKTDKIHPKRAQIAPNLARAMPPVKFYPHELVEDYIADDEAIYAAEREVDSEVNNTPVPGLRTGACPEKTQLPTGAPTKRKWTPARRPGTGSGTSSDEDKPP